MGKGTAVATTWGLEVAVDLDAGTIAILSFGAPVFALSLIPASIRPA
jgi:hypothetical protein